MARIISGRGLRMPILFDLCIFINSEIVSLLSLNFNFMGASPQIPIARFARRTFT